ncbi:MAG: polyprotein [Fushun cicadella viridis iflavirus 1]|nr:MAG: polyprotein [Fushun cicadella viridis iflavirus 1]
MKNWKLAHKPIFEKQKTLIDEGMSDICIPIYFINSAPSTSTMDYDKKMNRLHAELFSDKSQHRIEIVKEAEKKGWKYHVLKAGKWILRQVIKIVGFALFITAAHGLATYIGNKLNIVPFDDESRAVVHDYVKGTGDARLNVNISDKVRNFFNIQPKNCQGQMAYDLKVPSAAKQAILPKLAISPQMAVDVESTLISKLNRNTFFLTMHKSSGTTRTFRCLGICGRRAIILDHYYYEYRKDDVVYLTVKYLNVEHVIDRNSLCHSTVENSAFVCLELPSNMNSFKDIRKLFIKSSQSSAIPTTCKIFESTQQYNMLVHNLPLSFRKTLSIPNDGHAATNLELVYEYPLSQAGLCGSVVATTGNMSNPIIGIHVAGTRDGKYGFAEPICYETIESMIGNLSEVGVVDCVEPQLGPIDKSRLKFEFNVNVLGVVDSSLAHHQPGSSTIVPTLCSGEITEVTYDIPVLHSKDARIMDNPFSPMLVGCSYHCLTPVPFNNIILKRAFDYYNGLILSSVKPLRPNVGVLSRSQAIVGIHNLEHYDPMEFSTSEGFPFVKDRPKGCGDKRWLFDLEAIPEGWKLNGINSKLVNVLDCKQTMRQRGIVPDTIFTDCLKDQKLPLEKVLIPGKTRIFSISPVDFTIQCRQYFMDFAVAYQEARFDADHAIGIDCNSIEWTVLANRLLSVSNNIVVADYTKFGPTLMASCVHYAFEIMINWYKFYAGEDEDAERIRRVMCEESKFAKHLMLNLVYRVGCGSPSGHPLTTILNSIVNSLYVLYAFLSCGFTTKEYVDNVKLITYGDDLIMSVSDSCISSFNCDVMSRIFSKYGIKLTDASKTGDVVMCRQLLDKDVTFLKRRFIPHSFRRGIFLAQLDIRSVLEVCNWTFKSIDLQTKSKESCYAMLENAYGAGEEFYENLRAKVAVWWRKHNYNFVAPSWHEVDERCFGIGSVR